MTIPDGLTRVVFSGTLCSNTEKWAFSLWWRRDGGSIAFDFNSGEPTDAAYVAFRTQMLALMRTEDTYTQLDSYLYGGGAAVEHHQVTFSRAGTTTTSLLPAQVALCLSLRTSTATRSGRGRIYLPARGMALSSTTGLAIATVPNAVVDALADYLTSVHTVASDTRAVVVSPTQSTSRVITQVDCDLVPDTQRRRRSKLTSTRHIKAVT